MVIKQVDLHTHTTASDGLQRPADNVRLAKAAGLAGVAITDHDTVDGMAEALEEGERQQLVVVPGVELSTVAGRRDIHILGYYMDWQSADWQRKLASVQQVRERRNDMIVDKLRQLGIAITMEEVAAKAKLQGKEGGSIGRPHIAAVLIDKGAAATMQEAFDRYLAAGAAAYAAPPRLDPFQAVKWIREAGGTSVVAHPGLYGDDELVEEIIASGAQGIEVYHPDHGEADERRYARLAAKHKLIITAGSDFHGAREGAVFHGPIGCRTVGADVLQALKPQK
ncbi:PHP domain-containing protein [Paenibacillus sp. GCM10027626]|uniref:PHP domain-containing protein n=1 Tax=Paenibacillus sp. GCM10027626 TaxID=3273411 RepID=UPI00363A901D